MERNKIDFTALFLQEDAEDLYENAPCAYLSTLPDGTVVKANETFFEWTGYPRHIINGMTHFRDLLPLAGKVYHDTHYTPLLLMQGFVKEIAFDMLCKGGQRLPVLLNSRLKKDASGNPLFIRTALLDARSRRAYEQELVAAKHRAAQAEEAVRRLNDLLEEQIAVRTAERDRLLQLSLDLLAVATVDGRFIRINPAFTATLGWSEAELKTFSFSELVHPDEIVPYREAMAELMAGRPLMRRVGRRRHKDGSYRWISWNIVRDAGKLYFTGRDITDEKRQAQTSSHAE